MTTATGRVWLAGAGPGDPDLLTVAARRLLDTADVVVHDRLVGTAILTTIPPRTLRFDVGKMGYGYATDQGQIVDLLVRLARRGRTVVRLKGGDPFVFGRGGEEVLALRAAGIDVRVVPGITAGLAGPALAGIPVTHRGVARSVAFVTGHGEAGGDSPDWLGVARADTVVAYMAGRTASAVGRALRAAGRPVGAPVAVIADASLPSQHVQILDLATLEASGVEVPAGAPVLIVVGDVVRLADVVSPRSRAIVA
jgi:uroporphyrin-III C-methyltransferase